MSCPRPRRAAQLVDHVRTRRRRQPHQVVVVHLDACGFVDVQGFRALLLLHDQVALHAGRLLVLDPPHTLRILCRAVPDQLVLVPAGASARTPGP